MYNIDRIRMDGDKMTSKIARNKRAKEEAIRMAGFRLYTEKGVVDTSIDDIVKEAGVGKGTFYLYFRDKYDLLEKLISQQGIEVIHRAAIETEERDFDDFEDQILYFIDSIIDYLEDNKDVLNLVHKSLSWNIIKKAIDKHEEVNQIYEMFSRGYNGKKSRDEIDIILFMIIDLVGSVSYSAIILEEPARIETVKPLLYGAVKGIINN